MSIFVTGDTHGSQSHGFTSVDGFMNRLSDNAFPEQRDLSKDDFVVICGDFGGVWSVDRSKVKESDSESYALDWLDKKPFTTLFIPGNHENYDRLTGCRDENLLDSWFFAKMSDSEKDKLRAGYHRKEWHGGHVREIRPSVLMLEHGEIYDLNGRSCFAFGGAKSHDIKDGILDPSSYPDEKAFKKDYEIKRFGSIRVKGISWWEDEIPSQVKMNYGRETVHNYMLDHDKIDLVFTHAAPSSDMFFLGYRDPDPVSIYLESLRDEMRYNKWFYGHLHDNRRVFDNHYLLYEQIIRIL